MRHFAKKKQKNKVRQKQKANPHAMGPIWGSQGSVLGAGPCGAIACGEGFSIRNQMEASPGVRFLAIAVPSCITLLTMARWAEKLRLFWRKGKKTAMTSLPPRTRLLLVVVHLHVYICHRLPSFTF
ncbi:unnamed protein product [Amoebophrya sp. A120]|nr:unnamed protein product [Amoebophrya sp. A120]|eukprot:GSA120T00019561001.1